MPRLLLMFLMAVLPMAWGDLIDENASLQGALDEALLDLHGDRWSAEVQESLEERRSAFTPFISSPDAKLLWLGPIFPAQDADSAAGDLGLLQGRLQHVAALEMLHCQQAGNIEAAKEWRAIIKLPKFASSVEGAMALQRLGGEKEHRLEVGRLLAREYIQWQITRAREKTDALDRLVEAGRSTPRLITARASEIEELSAIPASLLSLALPESQPVARTHTAFDALIASATASNAEISEKISAWKLELEGAYPNLLSPEDVLRRERIILKLLRLIPMEYQSGVRNGEVVIPIEYSEAKSFAIQCQQIVNELIPVWRQTKAEALQAHGTNLVSGLEHLEDTILRKRPTHEIEASVKGVSGLLEDEFDLSLKRAGTAADVVAETTLEIRSLLGQSLAAAQNGQWKKAEALRLDAYVNFDLELESRAMPRDPGLALAAEKTFLDGAQGQPGIAAALSMRLKGDELTASYQRAFDALDETASLLRVGLSPAAATMNAILIVLREGLEAVVILAALLAGLRGRENAGIRRQIGFGAGLALVATAVLFVLSRYLISGLSRHGETLEVIISIIAVIVLLIVTNWVFHKYYWSGWNAKLRQLSKAALSKQGTGVENLALVGVGFATIFREGFETTLFMQSLILEAGMKPVMNGLAIGGAVIAVMGIGVFYIGAKLPYRKMLVYTGVLVVLVLFTFLGSTARLLQTVGWLPVHPIPGFSLPNWTGIWFGLYPTWEGIIAPSLAFVYVGTAWLWVKFSVKRKALRLTPGESALPAA
jgi:high-affinity iron transporter